MLKKTVVYTAFDGSKVTEVLCFNLNKVEFTKFAARYSDYTGLNIESDDASTQAIQKYINNLIEKKDLTSMILFFEDFILSAYGEVSEDRRHFVKTKEMRESFENSLAYAELFDNLFSNGNEEAISDFMFGVVGIDGASLTNK